jgi:predicted nucleic acid-binding protein
MELDTTKLISALLGLLVGVAGTLVTPWVNWGIEKKREKQRSRKELIQRTRELLDSPEWDQLNFSSTVTYSEIRQHLTERTIKSIEDGAIFIQVGRGGNVIKSSVLDDVAKKEKEWGII